MATKRLYPEGLLGTKEGMTQVFTEDGKCIPVTVIKLGPCTILEVKNQSTHGYDAVKLGFQAKEIAKMNKPQAGNFKKWGKGAFRHTKEMRCHAENLGWTSPGKELSVSDVFSEGDKVDVSGTTIGRGFAGVVKKFRVAGQPSTQGTHEARRNIGSIGNCADPGRVFKNRKMPGQFGNVRVTTQNLKVVSVNEELNVILVKGAVPGAKGCLVEVRKSVKGYVLPKKIDKPVDQGSNEPVNEERQEQAA